MKSDWRFRVSRWTGAVVLQRRFEYVVVDEQLYALNAHHYVWRDATVNDLADYYAQQAKQN